MIILQKWITQVKQNEINLREIVDFDEYFKQKKFGGLGIHLIKKLMDDLMFDHDAGKTTIKITKHIN